MYGNRSRTSALPRPWITHCSLQRIDLCVTTEKKTDIRKKYEKPVVWDEIVYEGNIRKWNEFWALHPLCGQF